jgi:hypothetical protein
MRDARWAPGPARQDARAHTVAGVHGRQMLVTTVALAYFCSTSLPCVVVIGERRRPDGLAGRRAGGRAGGDARSCDDTPHSATRLQPSATHSQICSRRSSRCPCACWKPSCGCPPASSLPALECCCLCSCTSMRTRAADKCQRTKKRYRRWTERAQESARASV